VSQIFKNIWCSG